MINRKKDIDKNSANVTTMLERLGLQRWVREGSLRYQLAFAQSGILSSKISRAGFGHTVYIRLLRSNSNTSGIVLRSDLVRMGVLVAYSQKTRSR